MATASSPTSVTLQAQLPANWSIADLQKHLGDIPLQRIRLFPPPGFATEEDVIQIEARENRLYELEDGILVEKPMGWYESLIAMLIGTKIREFLNTNDLGQVLGADGSLRILPGMVKIPDVSFIGWDRFPDKKLARRPIPELIPDLAVEVLSETNTASEMDEKLAKYFQAGVRLVWFIDPVSRSARVYTSPTNACEIDENGTIHGGHVLPGFELSLSELFEQADRQGPRGLQ